MDSNRFKSVRRGAYLFSFFKLNVDVIDELDNPEKLEGLRLSTFFHEYIHFLQDITTTFGLINSCEVANQMRYCNEVILAAQEPFAVPISFPPGSVFDTNAQLRPLYLGYPSPELYKMEVVKVEKKDSDVYLPAPFEKYASKVQVTYRDSSGGEGSFSLGGLHLCENMCHIAQVVFHPEVSHDDAPYRVAELVAKNVYGVIGNEPLFVFSLCEACLMHMHPGELFYECLVRMKGEGFVPKTEWDVYAFVYKRFRDSEGDLLFHFERHVILAIDQLTGYFTTDEYRNEKTWIFHVLEEARKLRKERPFLLLSLLKEPKLYSLTLKEIMFKVGTPLMQNLDGNCWFMRPYALSHLPIQPDRFAALAEIYELWMGGKKSCHLKGFCRKNLVGSTVDDRCDDAPWSRCKRDEPVCSYAQFWGTWGLLGKEPT
jgi:hypothetical protein